MLHQRIRKSINLLPIRFSGTSFAKKCLKGYKFPEIGADECEQQHIRGSGPGGSCVNSVSNAVLLKHKPTNCVVRVHESRKLHENLKIAQERLKLAVDRRLNGENSYIAQFDRLMREYKERAEGMAKRRREEKAMDREVGEEIVQRQRSSRENSSDKGIKWNE